jgi:predicted ATPase/DNA-binding winged helix-turn-helix (wHTH) protein
MDESTISFGPFRLLSEQRLLLEGGKPVRLGSRAIDILLALVERAGEVVGKEELVACAWPQTFVAESNLKIQVSALRRALGDGQGGHRYIATVPGRGYSFVAPVRFEAPLRAAESAPVAAGAHNLPLAVTRLIGREESAATLVSRLSRQRLVTVVGPGGIGKTALALAVAESMIAAYEHGVWLIDLGPLSDPRLVPSAVATVIGLGVRLGDPLPGLVAGLRDKQMLLLLDNCEHVIDGAAGVAAAVLGGASGINILATSREPLGVAGEGEYRLGPLNSPPPSSMPTVAEAEAFPAVQLFVERVTAIVETFALTDANAAIVGDICRRLDGLPLAIEFAAPRVEVLGVEGLAARLDGSMPLLGARYRTAMPRHRTMRAVIDWSYGLLEQDEQPFFRALGIFAGGFTVEAAAAVAMGDVHTQFDAIDRLAGLVDKSLVVADVSGSTPWFRLLDTTRAYAVAKLNEGGEHARLARRHAEYYRGLFERAEGEVAARSAHEWLADYAREVGNLRAALDWAFSQGGDGSIGVTLTAAAVPLWKHLSLVQECRNRAKQALDALAAGTTGTRRDEMKLHTALAGASTLDDPEIGAGFTKALDIAESLGDAEYQLRALSGLYFYYAGSSQYRAALPFALRFLDLAKCGSDVSDRLFGEHILGLAKHYLGDQIGARHHLEQVLIHHAADHDQAVIRFGTDLRVSARTFLARVLWLQGCPDQAVSVVDRCLGEAQALGHAMSLCYALALAACPVALWVGDLSAAARYTGMLLDHSRKHNSQLWGAFGSRYLAVVVLSGGNVEAGLGPLDTPEIIQPDLNLRTLTGLSELAASLARAGRVAEGAAVLEAAIERSEGGWLTPELLRLRGEFVRISGTLTIGEAPEVLFLQALDRARRQHTLAWELRAATSLAHLLRDQDRPAEAIACLEPVYGRFTEGFGTADLIAAKRLLHELHDGRN